ncbi:MAG: hypothetical protein GWP19_00275 [Planctomycetia bacterium]|nr:hypothetical protein [Planctomycetia bacterium]
MKNRNIVQQLPQKDEWITPDYVFKELNKEFDFHLDLTCSKNNCKTIRGCMIDKGNDGLKFDVERFFEKNDIDYEAKLNIWCNPPYSRNLKEAFIKKCIELSKSKLVGCVVMLLPVSTSTQIFHRYIIPNAEEIRFIEKRINFEGINTKNEVVKNKAGMHDSMVVVIKSPQSPNFKFSSRG